MKPIAREPHNPAIDFPIVPVVYWVFRGLAERCP